MKGGVLMTGESSGFGKCITERFEGSGWKVFGTSRRARAPSDAEIQKSGTIMLPLDVCDPSSVARLISRLLQLGRFPDTVILNAGMGIAGPIEQTSDELSRRQFETNFWGAHRVVRACLPHMRQRGGGRFILISSLASDIPLPFQAFYSASKAALSNYAKALRMEVMAHGIEVSVVEPGDHRTEFAGSREHSVRLETDPYEPHAHRAVIIMEKSEANGRDPKKLADLVLSIASATKPSRSCRAAMASEHIVLALRQLLPQSWFERLIMWNFEVPRALPKKTE